MNSKKSFINRLTKYQKIKYLFLLVMFILFLTIGLPTFSRIKNRSGVTASAVWDGTVALSFNGGVGTLEDPYIISNASELAFLGAELANNDFENTYFSISNDIIINEGTFSYNETDGIRYYLNNNAYYMKEYTGNYYNNIEETGDASGTINNFTPLNNFKGVINGNSHSINGLYMTDTDDYELGLFTNLSGTISDLYVENAVVYGGTLTAGIASSASDAVIKKVLFNGYVVGSNEIKNYEVSNKLSDVTFSQNSTVSLLHNNILSNNVIISSTLTGNCTGVESITINGVETSCAAFSINLNNTLLDSVNVTTNGDATLTNLRYNILLQSGISGGIVGLSQNTSIDTVVNKGFVFGKKIAGGLYGASEGTAVVNHAYNTGNITSEETVGGIVGKLLNSEFEINKTYNSGVVTGTNNAGLIGTSTGCEIEINNSFNADANSVIINSSNSSVISALNSYYVNLLGNPSNITNFSLVNSSDLQTKTYSISTLNFNEYQSLTDLETNVENVWVYDNYSLPILYIDDINNSVASLHVSTYSWNNFSDAPDEIKLKSNILFSIEDVSNLMPNIEKKYYIQNSNVPIATADLENLTWTSYSLATSISDEGPHIIYARVIDNSGNIVYLNSDILTLDKTAPTVTINMGNKSWTSANSNDGYKTINSNQTLTISSVDNLSGVASTEYYLSNTRVNSNSITEWNEYVDQIVISEHGSYILYAKVIDNHGNITITSTDLIIYDSYTISSFIGKNSGSYNSENKYLSNKSAISFAFAYDNYSEEINVPVHKLTTSFLVPVNTIITLKDNVNYKTYKYVVSTAANEFSFTSFVEVGSSVNRSYVEESYYSNNRTNENFTVIFDFIDTSVTTNLTNNTVGLNMYDDVDLIKTATSDAFNIYVNSDATINLSSSTNNNINLNSDSETSVELNSIINYASNNNYSIFDTRYEKMNLGIAIKMEDAIGNIISKDSYKNMMFEIGTKKYFPGFDNIVRINLKTIASSTNTLKITTKLADSNLADGTYYLKINNFASDSGLYYNALGSDTITIPVVVSNLSNPTNYSYDVIVNDSFKIINKTNQNQIEFKILKKGELSNPSVRVSLYKKNDLTYTNQDYTLIDLNTYTDTILTSSGNMTYYAAQNMMDYNGNDNTYNLFSINLLASNLDNTGYKFVFDLYEDNKKINTIEKYFIVR